MTTNTIEHLVTIVTTDLAAVTRGRPVPASLLEKTVSTGVGWVPANLSLTPFGGIVPTNPWGSSGDIRLVPDLKARYTTEFTGAKTPFDVVVGDLVNLDGSPWVGCTRTLLKQAIADLKSETGLSLIGTFEQEFQIFDSGFPDAHPFSVSALRRADPFPATLFAALKQAGIDPEMILAEYGPNQFEVTNGPADALVAADRAIVIREITRELTRNFGWRASFSPKAAPDAVGNGVHIHFSFHDKDGRPVTYDHSQPGGLSNIAGAFCAGVLKHLPAITCLSASSVPSYYRLKPHNWSSSYTWMANLDREASLRICPVVTINNRDPARQFNIEFRVADATANPYFALAALVRAGLEGLRAKMNAPNLFSGDPESLSNKERAKLNLRRLPQTLEEALQELASSDAVNSWFPAEVMSSFTGVKNHEIAHCANLEPADICDLYGRIY
ncbi:MULTISPECIES: type I glutamate--ammonia ligase [Rhizobium/Agrobacterium group]|uniref:glutamine synthetase family protein n=1 Tax=Agrobacterium rosae TaxID=1972867 RepID=UPI002033F1C4|nr:glutamine synthetase [Agrobacterium rosae]